MNAMKLVISTVLLAVILSLYFMLHGCDSTSPTVPDVNITGDNNDVTIVDQDNENGDNTNTNCCDDNGNPICYSIPSCSIRSCEGGTIGVNTTFDPNDPLCITEEE